jgi:CRP/FNR family transcriptional regulator
MNISLVASEANEQICADCAARPLGVCAALNPDELRELDHLGHHVRFIPRQTVFAQEELTTSFYNLREGVMRLYKLLPDGRRQIVGFAIPGDFLGMATSARHGFSADALGPVAVCRFSKASFARFIENKPNLLRRINELVVRELSQAQDHMLLLGRRSAEEKVASFLLGWRDRLAWLGDVTNMVPLPMGRQDIADFLGLTIETVSRTFTKLERDGLIEIMQEALFCWTWNASSPWLQPRRCAQASSPFSRFDPYQRRSSVAGDNKLQFTGGIVMPIDTMLVSAAVISMFLVFAGALAWAEIQTRPARLTAVAHSQKRRAN